MSRSCKAYLNFKTIQNTFGWIKANAMAIQCSWSRISLRLRMGILRRQRSGGEGEGQTRFVNK